MTVYVTLAFESDEDAKAFVKETIDIEGVIVDHRRFPDSAIDNYPAKIVADFEATVRAEAVADERRRIDGLLRQVDLDAAIQGNWSMGKYAKAVRDVRDLLVEEGTDG